MVARAACARGGRRALRVWHAGSGQPLVILVEADETTTVAVGSDGQALASAGPSGVVGVRRAGPSNAPRR